MASILAGLVGGLLATVVMTALMMTIGDDSPPPTAAFWSKYVGDDPPAEYMMQGMVLHFLYGTVAGIVFVLVVPLVLSVSTLTAGIIAGLAYAIVLFVVAAVFWMRLVLGMEPELQQVVGFLAFHLAYGLVLGGVVGLNVL
ncbi:hypothetical protein KU306_01585 [Haloferax larsenii]|uniref:DUF1761 domain-containing protein n=1 Tax=Haloferax larsenii TaxID=302484 RepID=A0ABY5RGR2_HALLR|nr:DUF6789 family protein [Haloferax larsenii]ELZ78084.1 hypothetical protein C455_10383 [Haloferax larsenii JCM 13917]UVE50618.1 hypothetical protein KU306_01585 [Haloferax larsenii]